MATSQHPVHVAGVSYSYRSDLSQRRVLHEVSLDIQTGEIVILTGPSGSGKTTLITLMGALRACQSGELEVLGHQLHGAPQRRLTEVRRQVGYIFQQHNLLDCLSVAENVVMSLQLAEPRLSRKEARERVARVLGEVGLEEHIDKSPAALSGGQKQRVGIARALAARPQLILADEPTASLDKDSGRNVIELIQRLCREEGTSVVLVTHDNRILDAADRILHLDDGEIQPVSHAVASSASRLLRLLDRHDPAAARYLSAFASALTRVAMADAHFDEVEARVIRDILNQQSGLAGSEVDLVMELAQSQVRARFAASADGEGFSETQCQRFVDAMYAVAEADGAIGVEEEAEILAVARELGFSETLLAHRREARA
ncbi:ATP-binding cassette domain-containing protein [Parahaliea maris]|uniref:Cell division ATP-binding protein FtsE n=1 Tax=Parahaliea maris TaxID=2716870 RepID=A0A5C9A9Y5_9GAMM|nr:ATP-binding cassette domain-containing protein [Parahaliea maris]TXS96091.1 ATP-binding cassette domain-containing protein [Parahaliea maris]